MKIRSWFTPLTSHSLLLTALAAAALAGCATTADIEKAKTTWHGATYDEVVARWGVPSRQTTLSDGSQVYSWSSEGGGGGYSGSSVGIFGGSGGVGVGIGLPLPGMGGGGELQRCERSLTFKSGRVVDQLWQGSPGFCSGFRRE
jgi:opacity protein-like surface antigen